MQFNFELTVGPINLELTRFVDRILMANYCDTIGTRAGCWMAGWLLGQRDTENRIIL